MQHWPWRTLASNAAGHSWDRLQRASLCRADADLDELSADGDGAAAAGAREIHDLRLRNRGSQGGRAASAVASGGLAVADVDADSERGECVPPSACVPLASALPVVRRTRPRPPL